MFGYTPLQILVFIIFTIFVTYVLLKVIEQKDSMEEISEEEILEAMGMDLNRIDVSRSISTSNYNKNQ